jgi:FAD/FMN-containing dehydrogenase
LAGQPNGYQHTGLYGVWNTSTDRSAYSVLAETEGDFQATVQFAAKHNLRLVVKATGHDWYGRSTAAGSLLLWTHQRKKITWHTKFPSPENADGVPAVTVQSGVQVSGLIEFCKTSINSAHLGWQALSPLAQFILLI